MTHDDLTQKKAAIEQHFNELATSRAELLKKAQEIEDEQKRMQGEYRLLEKLIDDWAQAAPTSKQIRKVVEHA
jgi:hypothetical protein